MNLRARVYVEGQKKDGEEKLAARLAMLKGKGISPEKIQKDATVRRLKAELRHSNTRLASIAAQEKLNQERVLAKEQKIAAKKAEREAALKGASAEPAEKKEKKGKKEKPEKEAKPEKKKEKKEKKTEAAPEAK
jgi:septal ring factor EnvC (AmiA/AmiB activator)